MSTPPDAPNPFANTQAWIGEIVDLDRTQDFSRLALTGAAPKILPLSTFGDFRLVGKLGAGGMGTVYKAVQLGKNRTVALKVMSKELAQRPGFLERFHREARAMGRLNHPNIVRCFAAGESDGFVYLAMEWVEGGSVGTRLETLGKFPLADAAFVAKSCAAALEYAHGQNLIHRDVKPDNLLIAKSGAIQLADLGLAKVTDEDADQSLTRTGVGIGTPLYAAPEQLRSAKDVDARCDLYSLGCVFYHLLAGRPPITAPDFLGLIKAKETGVYVSASRVAKGIPASVDRLLAKLLAKVPEHRFASASEFLQELEWAGVAGAGLTQTN